MGNFTDYETAKKLKELGFKDVCYGFFAHHKDGYYILDLIKSKNEGGVVSSPMWQQVKEWLWNNNKIMITCEICLGGIQFFVWKEQIGLGLHDDDVYFDSPIKAETQGIKMAVEHLYDIFLKEEREEYRKKNSISHESGVGIQTPRKSF